MSPKLRALGSRWLGVGLAAALSALTLGLALGGQLHLYISPDSTWFAVSMAVVGLLGCALSFLVPLGSESHHDHDHGGHDEGVHASTPRRGLARAGTAVAGVLASIVVVGALVLRPASLSPEVAMSRDLGSPPLFGGRETVTLAATGDVTSFGIGQWATVFATAPNPRAFDGSRVTLTGFITPGADGATQLTRLVITHCVIDAQPAGIPFTPPTGVGRLETGAWVTLSGTVKVDDRGRLIIVPSSVQRVSEPKDPYEY